VSGLRKLAGVTLANRKMKAKYVNIKDEVFLQAFHKAELVNLGQAERDRYENSLKIYRDLKGVIDTAFDEGKLEGKLEVARSAKQMGLSVPDIAKMTGLTEDEISKLSAGTN
jgi:predicted transposase/invertase (TIGR01784 family)